MEAPTSEFSGWAAKMKFAGYQLLQDESVRSYALTASLVPLAVALQEAGELLATFVEMPDELHFLFDLDGPEGNLADSLQFLRDLCSASMHPTRLASDSLKAAREMLDAEGASRPTENGPIGPLEIPVPTGPSWSQRIAPFVADPYDESLAEVSGLLEATFHAMYMVAVLLTEYRDKPRMTLWDEIRFQACRISHAYDESADSVRAALRA